MAQGSSNPTSNLQKVAGTAVDTNTGNASAGTQRVVLATNQPAVPVTGNFYQGTQPVSGTFWQTTQPVSGTFWQATQPVSGPLTDAQLRAATVPVSGTVTVAQATAANLNATVTGTIELGATSLAALENISVTVPGTVDLGTISLNALESITVVSGTPGNFQIRGYGAVTTAAPTYTTGTDNALSLNTSGGLRVDGSGVTQPVSGTFWQTTQPVSGPLTDTQLRASAVPITGTLTNLSQLGGTAISMNTGVRDAGTQRVTIATNDVVPVTGTFWQTTQPVSIASMPSTPVTGTFYQATQPVSIASMPSTPVTGTFWQTTQPVSQTLGSAATRWYTQLSDGTNSPAIKAASTAAAATDPALVVAISPNNTVGVTGTFYQATQPVSIAASVAVTGPLTDTQLRASAVPITGTLTNLSQLGGTAISMNTGVRDAGTQRVTIATNDVVPVTGTFYQATQPVSIASMPSTPVTGTFYQATQPVSIASMPSTPVTGTFWQATQPVSGTVTAAQATPASLQMTATQAVGSAATRWYTQISDGTNSPAIKAASTAAAAADPALVVAISPNNTVPVSLASVPTHGVTGTFWQATQPVSIAAMPSTPVTGTFWQTTQPVSIATMPTTAVTIAAMPSTPVTGTFWQATQPVSIASMPSTPVTGTFWQATQPVSGTVSVNALPAGSNTIGNVGVVGNNTSTTTAYAASLTIKAGSGALYLLNGFNSKTSGQFIQIHNTTAQPANGVVPVVLFYVPANSNFSFDFGIYGRAFSTGIFVINSSTGPTLTPGSSDCWFDATYK